MSIRSARSEEDKGSESLFGVADEMESVSVVMHQSCIIFCITATFGKFVSSLLSFTVITKTA